MLKKVDFGFMCLALGILLGASTVSKAQAHQPNIVVFLVDDMGWQDTSVPFYKEATPTNRRFHTPAMERLAAVSTKFTAAYAAPVCTPSRISLMTGQNAARHGVTNWTLRKDIKTDGKHENITPPDWNVNGLAQAPGTPLTTVARPLPDILRSYGYRTIHVGKAHFGAIGTPGANPLNLGFEVNIGGHAAGSPGSYLGVHNYSGKWKGNEAVWDVPGLEAYHGSNTFLTEALTLEASKAVELAVRDKKPFFLYMAHYAVHIPLERDERFYAKYLAMGLDDKEACYAALIEGMDKSLGDIMDKLLKLGVLDNTVIIFMSDNGGLSAEGRGGKPNTHNLPLKSGKGSAYEGGIRVPMMVHLPKGKAATSKTPVIIEDLFPTILELAGVPKDIKLPQKVDGLSLVKAVAGAKLPERPLVWHYPNIWGPSGPGIQPFSAIREGQWKLIYFHNDGHKELYQISEDEAESKLRTDRKEVVAKLSRDLRTILVERGAKLPFDRKLNRAVSLP